jgi:hypothetical protein
LSASRSGVRLICHSLASASSSIHGRAPAAFEHHVPQSSRHFSCSEAGRSGVASTMVWDLEGRIPQSG